MNHHKKMIKFPWWLRLYILPAWFMYGTAFALFFVCGLGIIDPDFGWHLASGRYYWAHGIPTHDIFTFSAQHFPWINHEWFSDMVLAAVYHLGGHVLVALLYAAMWTLAFWLVARRCRLSIIVIAGAIACLPFAGVRAITWTVLCAAVLYELFRASRRTHWLIPFLMLVWANLHGGFIIGLAYIAYRLIARPSWRLAVITAVSVLATTVTPYGAAIYVEIIRTLGDRSLHGRISEWQSLAFSIEVALLAAVWATCRYFYTRSVWRTAFAFPMFLIIGTVMSVRNVPILVIFAVADIAHMMVAVPLPWVRIRERLQAIRPLMIALALIVVSFGGYLLWRDFMLVRVAAESRYPREIAQSLQTGVCSHGNLYNDYNIGGYLIWRAPRQKVYIDGRMPSWQYGGVKIMDNYYRVVRDASFRQREFARFHIVCAAIPADTAFAKELRQSGWKPVIANSAEFTLLKASE